MTPKEIHVVTGAFGFSGKYIAQRLLDAGKEVRTLTNSVSRANPFQGRVEAFPYNFDDEPALIDSLLGASVLYNNYWVRFTYGSFSYDKAVDNSVKLFTAAKKAGIRRVVHVSITNPSLDSPYEYFRGKARLEEALIESGLSYAILRPAVLFGREDILINNIAWFLRRFPVFGIFGDGKYRVQPISVDDLAKLAVGQGQKKENILIDAVGPEPFTYRELVAAIGRAIGKPRPIISLNPHQGQVLSRIVGFLAQDITLTREEIHGLMDGLLYTGAPPAGETKLTEWLTRNASFIGKHYASELRRRRNRTASYIS